MFHPENRFLHNQWLARPHSWKIRDSSHCIGTGTLGCDQGKGNTGEVVRLDDLCIDHWLFVLIVSQSETGYSKIPKFAIY